MTQRRWFHLAVGVMVAVGVLTPRAAAAQGVAVSETNITIAGDDVLTMGDATPLYARGTGLNNEANRLVKLGDTVLVDNDDRGMTLTLFDANGHVSSTNYDTWGSSVDSDALAAALATLASNQIGLLTSADAFEWNITPDLRTEARRLGLVRLATHPNVNDVEFFRHPYVAIFHGSPAPAPNRHAVEILQSNDAGAPYAILATWLMDGGFVGQALPERRPDPPCFNTTQRFVDCNTGTVTDTVTGLIYLKNANCFGLQDWPTANQSAAGLSSGQCGLSDGSRAGDWRLPSVREYDPILSATCDPPVIVGNGNPGCYADTPWADGVQSGYYWTATSVLGSDTMAFFAKLDEASSGDIAFAKTTAVYVWPVRGRTTATP